jgi:hypothetical protein
MIQEGGVFLWFSHLVYILSFNITTFPALAIKKRHSQDKSFECRLLVTLSVLLGEILKLF